MKFIQKHKRLLIIVLIALIIIGTAYYFTLGKPTSQTTSDASGGDVSGSGSSNATPTSSGALGAFPLKWDSYNAYTKTLQARLNKSITTCKRGSTLREDGYLGDKTVSAIKTFFPNIGNSVATNKYVTEDQFNTIINSQPGCV